MVCFLWAECALGGRVQVWITFGLREKYGVGSEWPWLTRSYGLYGREADAISTLFYEII